eukprot:160541-Chlamydomonas_euryale.AAC.2
MYMGRSIISSHGSSARLFVCRQGIPHAGREATCDTSKGPPNWAGLVEDMNAHIAVTIVAKGAKPELFYSTDEALVLFVYRSDFAPFWSSSVCGSWLVSKGSAISCNF